MRVLFLFVAFIARVGCAEAQDLVQPKKLVVVLSYDQFRGDFPQKWEHTWGSRGFRRVATEGAYFPHCYYNHANNMTGPGHAVLLTGMYPAKTGIVSNDFFDRELQRRLNCVEDMAVTVIGVSKPTTGISPVNLAVPTIGDLLREQSPTSKVIAISGKDRGAVLMGGHKANLALWLEPDAGGFTSSTYYVPALPQWVAAWHKQNAIALAAGKVWRQALPDSSYTVSDTLAWEGRFPDGDNAFPHTVPNYDNANNFWYGFLLSPWAIEAEFSLARAALEAEQLGSDDAIDILCISVSTTDYVGHLFGPDSREMQDIYYHADRILGDFIDTLDTRVGRKNYVLVITSDHGVAPIPESLLADNIRPRFDAGRLRGIDVLDAAEVYLDKTFPTGSGAKWVREFVASSLFLNDSAVAASGVEKNVIADSLCAFLVRYEGIGIAIARHRLAMDAPLQSVPSEIERRVRNDFFPSRIGDILLYPKMYWISGSTPATHGTPYDYDRHVPLYVFGGGIAFPSESTAALTEPADIAPTLARILDVPLHNTDGKVLPYRVETK